MMITITLLFVAIIFGRLCHYNNGIAAALVTRAGSSSTINTSTMWRTLSAQQPLAWKTIFGEKGERGEYMDGYSQQSMMERCMEDYKWEKTFSPEAFASERANMMSHLYDNEQLWKHVCMVAFAEHYVLTNDDNDDKEEETLFLKKTFETFQKQKDLQSRDNKQPIFSGVVCRNDWHDDEENENNGSNNIDQKLVVLKEKGIDYVRLECNFGSVDDIGGDATQLANNPLFSARFRRLAEAAKGCQKQEMVPLVLLQVPWREPDDDSDDYFKQAIQSLAVALKNAGVDSRRLLLETRPPVGVSSREEKGLPGTMRASLGLQTGHKMFEAIQQAFDGDTIAGFCVAGGSTKGDFPTAMEDDTQNAVRQGIRHCAMQNWGYELCFWEMGAKLMLQPKVGRLWGSSISISSTRGRDAARELFQINAEDMADEIKAGHTAAI